MTTDQITQAFREALAALEGVGNVEPIVALYAENAQVGNMIHSDKFHGPNGARQFWTEYRGTFDHIQSTFRSMIVGDGRAALEWSSQGTSFDGKPIGYSGVTILDISDGKIIRSCAYFNPSALGQQIL